eukprot:TRINITY_DN7198_c0_g1_i2.p1 TRINITY_DN7198_c0_g1~~TRINITY_DN7198_c0_g1_i2.p1  ORF type:complete len:227 (+),score=49.76 TRINITY_DN7198_c0_g1_i2:73-681(+)
MARLPSDERFRPSLFLSALIFSSFPHVDGASFGAGHLRSQRAVASSVGVASQTPSDTFELAGTEVNSTAEGEDGVDLSSKQLERSDLEAKLSEARAALAANLAEQVDLSKQIEDIDDVRKSDTEIDDTVSQVTNETDSAAMANFLGKMWKEIRALTRPSYKEHLEQILAAVEAKNVELRADFEGARAAALAWSPHQVDFSDS